MTNELEDPLCEHCDTISTIEWDNEKKIFVCGNCRKPSRFTRMISPKEMRKCLEDEWKSSEEEKSWKSPDGAGVEQPLPCKHEWRQYFKMPITSIYGYSGSSSHSQNGRLQEEGFFCIHCLERREK